MLRQAQMRTRLVSTTGMDAQKLLQMLTLLRQPQALLQLSRVPQMISLEWSIRATYATLSHH